MRYPRIPFDVIASRPVRRLVLSRWFPLVLQVGTLAVVAFLAVNALGLGANMGEEALTILRKTNLTMLLVWGIWWPGMIAVALGLGRVCVRFAPWSW